MKAVLLSFILVFPLYGANTQDDYLIDNSGLYKIHIGDAFSDFIDYYRKKFIVIHKEGNDGDYEAGVSIYDNDKLAVKIANKNWGLPPHIVKIIEIYSPKFHTKEGVRVGMKISDLHKLFPEEKADKSGLSVEWSISPQKYQTGKDPGAGKRITFNIILSITNESADESSDVTLDISSVEGTVKSIMIYDEN